MLHYYYIYFKKNEFHCYRKNKEININQDYFEGRRCILSLYFTHFCKD